LRCFGLHIKRVRHGKGDRAEAAEKAAEETASLAVGDAECVVLKERVQDGVDFDRDFGGFEPRDATAKLGPVPEARVAVPFGEGRRAGDGGFGGVVAAQSLVTGGGAAAVAAGGQDVGAFASHLFPPEIAGSR
jgi:hypothetical protein